MRGSADSLSGHDLAASNAVTFTRRTGAALVDWTLRVAPRVGRTRRLYHCRTSAGADPRPITSCIGAREDAASWERSWAAVKDRDLHGAMAGILASRAERCFLGVNDDEGVTSL